MNFIINFLNYFYSALDWKASVEDAATFLDGGKLPCILVENKADLLDNNEGEGELTNFAQENGFIKSFRASAKEGTNINESMDFLIQNIIKRMEDMSAKENKEVFTTERKVVTLDADKHVPSSKKKDRKNNCC